MDCLTTRRWTSEEDRVLRDLYATTTADDLCAIMGRSRRSVCARLHRLGIRKSHKWNTHELSYLLQHSGSMPHAEIASVLGVSRKSVSRAIERYGMFAYRHGLDEHQQRRFKNLHTRGYSDLQIARKLKLTKSRVLRHRLRLGLSGNGYTDKSYQSCRSTAKETWRQSCHKAAVVKWGTRLVAVDELVEIAMQFIEGNDEMLGVVWEAMRLAWCSRSTIADMAVAAQDGLMQFRRQTFSWMSIDSFVNDDGKRIEVADRLKLRPCG